MIISCIKDINTISAKKSYLFILFIFFLCPKQVISVTSNSHLGSRQSGLANTGVALIDIWSIVHNQAGLANIKTPAISLYHSNEYNIKGLGTKAIALIIPFKYGAMGLNISSYGNNSYHENKLNLAMSKKICDKFSAGIQIGYFEIQMGEYYGKANNITFEGGLIYEASNKFIIGAHIFNPFKSGINNLSSDKIPTIMKFGIGLTLGKNVLFSTETEKATDKDPLFKVSFEYNYKKTVFLRTGISGNPIQNCFGGGYMHKNLTTDIACIYHQILGYSLNITCTYSFKKNKTK